MYKTGVGQDSHRFDFDKETNEELVLGGVVFKGETPLHGNSDADVILHAVTNAVSGVTGVNILGSISDKMCVNGIKDSRQYLEKALEYLSHYKIDHLSLSIECLKPKISPKINKIKESLALILGISKKDIGITATTGEGLTAFGRGEGIQVFAIITVAKNGSK
ncbi:MAG: 2-C-methyl-D-erythritol 2,4-cyclodiphosphate synthase [Halanaerobiales bacterium]